MTLVRRLAGHADRPVELHRSDGRLLVTKRYADAATAEAAHRTLVALWASPFGASRRPPGSAEPLWFDAGTATVACAHVPGRPLAVATDGTPAVLDAVAGRLGEVAALVAGLHRSGVVPTRRRYSAKVARLLAARLTDAGPAAGSRAGLAADLCAAAPDRVEEALVCAHGDLAPPNILIGTAGACVIDLDRAQLAPAGRDLAYFGAWCWVRAVLDGAEPAWDLADELLGRYAAVVGAGPAALVPSAAFHRAAALVRTATEWSALQGPHGAEARGAVLAEAARWARRGATATAQRSRC